VREGSLLAEKGKITSSLLRAHKNAATEKMTSAALLLTLVKVGDAFAFFTFIRLWFFDGKEDWLNSVEFQK
jgi:hypothetical protein